jgi:nicotinate-nucleotide adenylyltransferase
MPAKYPPHKSPTDLASETDRLNMLKLTLKGHSRFEISDLELRREGLSYTVDSLREIRGLYPEAEIFFIIGADNISEMESWFHPEEIFESATVAAFTRPGFEHRGKFLPRIKLYRMTPVDISSTGIRERIRKNQSVAEMVPEAVREYIIKKKLYRN